MIVDFHQIAQEHYAFIYRTHQDKLLLPKPFSVSMFKQMALYHSVYMRRISEHETHRIVQLDKAFKKIAQVESKLEHYDLESDELNRRVASLEQELAVWDERIVTQKAVYKTAVDECRREERLIEEMNANLEKLRAAVNVEGINYYCEKKKQICFIKRNFDYICY